MEEETGGILRFKTLGNNCADCGFTLEGLHNTEGIRICEMIESAVREGRMAIEIIGSQILFIAEGIACVFHEKSSERLSAIKAMLKSGEVQIEPFLKPNYHGFSLTKSTR